MKVFKAVEWDADASGDAVCQESFKNFATKKVHERKILSKNNLLKKQKQHKKLKKSINDFKVASLKSEIVDQGIEQPSDGQKNNRKKKKNHSNLYFKHNNVKENIDSMKNDVQRNKTKFIDPSITNKSETSRKFQKHNRREHKYLEIKETFECLDHLQNKKKTKKKHMLHKSLIEKFVENNKKQEDIFSSGVEQKTKKQDKLKAMISQHKNKPMLSLRQKMMAKLKAARFRFINEQIYSSSSKETQRVFERDPEAFKAYHEGYRQQVKSWPLNPLDNIINSIKTMPKIYVIADFGCGDARLSKSVVQKVHSFDLVAINDNVTACDMANVPLEDCSINVAVFCLSLMGTNLNDYLLEVNRVLKIGGLLKIAEVESRFKDVEIFIKGVQIFGFRKTRKDLSHNLFYFLDFKKENNVNNKKKLPSLSLLPCLYKKR